MTKKLAMKNMKCTGCGCCAGICPTGAIEMQYNEEYDGSLEAIIKEEKCIGCNKCEKACPLLTDYAGENLNDSEPDLYAVQADDSTRFNSSSGGAFTALASYMLSKEGYVCGVAFNDRFKPEFRIINDIKDLDCLRGSKYVQADSGTIYPAIKELLDNGKGVLFTGCPCQVAGLNSYLGNSYSNLITVDLICSNTPPYPAFEKYLAEKYDINKIRNIRFRTKTCGWVCDICEVTDLNGSTEILRGWNDAFQKAFHPLLMMRQACEQCCFAGIPRVGDFSIGDFWFIDQFEPELDDKKGTSCLFLNNEKAREIFQRIGDTFKLCKKVPLDYMRYNRQPGRTANIARDYFYKLLKSNSFADAVDKALNRKFDIGVWGVWTEKNYGSEVTYFALYKLLEKMGYNVMAFERPKNISWPNGPNKRPVLFKTNPYPAYATFFDIDNKTELKELNSKCDTFIVGSDQMWHHDLYEAFGKVALLDFIHNDKKKIAYATSFGREEWTGPDKARGEISFLMRMFDYVSVREQSGVKICKEMFDVDAERVLDPVFLCDKDIFCCLAENSSICREKNNHIGVYLLDPTEEKMNVTSAAERILEREAFIITDAGENQVDLSRWQGRLTKDAYVEDWLCNFIKSDFVITDSFHGTCFAIIFNKPFVSIVNSGRGAMRFYELLEPLGLTNRIYNGSLEDVEDIIRKDIEFESINIKLADRKKESKEWLKKALEAEKNYSKTDLDYAMEFLEEEEIKTYRLIKELRIRDAWYGDRLDGLERDRVHFLERFNMIDYYTEKLRHPLKSIPAYAKNRLKQKIEKLFERR